MTHKDKDASMDGRRVPAMPRALRMLVAALLPVALAAHAVTPPDGDRYSRPYHYLASEPEWLFRQEGQLAQATAGDRHVVRFSLEAARNAARTGEAPVELPDGRRYALRVEREALSDRGDWTLVAEVDTPLGVQSAVLTYGSDGVFGVLPTPDGELLQVTTSRGVSVIAPAGGMVPAGLSAKSAAADVLLAPPLPGASPDPPTLAGEALAAAGEVQIDVLGVYTSDLVELHGSVSAAESAYTNALAIANQAYIDSGSTVRLNLVGLVETDLPATTDNSTALSTLTGGTLPDGVDVHALRDSTGADLVAMLRPYRNGHGSCGVAWLNGGNLAPHGANPAYGYSVSNVAPCGPYVLAHELGHNLGSHHDAETASGSYGAYPYSYGFRQDGPPAFATVMAYLRGSMTWLGQFSHPGSTKCEGVPCGVADQADNVRSLDLMAPRIARFRDPAGTISVLDGSVAEGDEATRSLQFVVRLATPAPAGGVRFDIATADGTATAGSDYLARSLVGQVIPEGQRTFAFDVVILGDLQEETDETFVVAIDNVVGAEIFTGSAIGVIRNDDPKVTISGKLRFADGAPAAAVPVDIRFVADDGFSAVGQWARAVPPEFRYAVSVPKSVRVSADIPAPPSPWVRTTVDLGVVAADLERDITVDRKWVLSGRIRFPAGQAPPDEPITLLVSGLSDDPYWIYSYVAVFPPDFRYEMEVFPSLPVSILMSTPPAPFLRPADIELGRLSRDTAYDIQLAAGAMVSGRVRFPEGVTPPNHPVEIRLSSSGGGAYDAAYPPDFRYAMGVRAGYRYSLDAETSPTFIRLIEDLGVVSGDVQRDVMLGLAPELGIADAIVTEGNASTSAEFELTLSKPTEGTVLLWLGTANASGIAGKDYVARQDVQVKFEPGETRKTLAVEVLGNATAEADRIFRLEVQAGSGFQPGRHQAFGVILDDDGATPSPALWVDSRRLAEGDQGQSVMRFGLGLSRAAPAGGVGYDIATADGSASAGSDYLARSLTGQTIAAGETAAVFDVPIVGDMAIEPDEVFTVRLGNVVGAVAAASQATGLIVNDDGLVPPKPSSDHYALQRDGSVPIEAAIGVLANDRHPTGRSVGAYLLDGNGPRNGQVNLATNGGFLYLPKPGFSGTDSFAYNACASGACAPARVELTVGDPLSTSDQYLWLLPPAANVEQQGFVRLTNRESRGGTVTVWGIDATGRRSTGTLSLSLAANESRQFNSQDAEAGNAAKGLTGSLGTGTGNWMLVLRSDLDLEALAYVRTPDGFLTAMHDRVVGDGVDWTVPVFNPAENVNQVSWLRVINTTMVPVTLQIGGVDDAGAPGQGVVTAMLPPLGVREFSAGDLEVGNPDKVLSGRLGDGQGKWRLRLSASGRVTVQSLLSDPEGYLTNLSTAADASLSGSERVLWMVPPAANAQQQGFIRLTNRENRSGNVVVWGVDDSGQRSVDTLSFALSANASKQLNSQDLENGNAAKSVVGSLGAGSGNWRLHVLTDLDVEAMALIRTPDGFLTTIHETVAATGADWRVPMFNPAANVNQVSVLRLVNPSEVAAGVAIDGVDDAGVPAPAGQVSLTLAPNAAVELTAQDLENGNPSKGLVGRLGAGSGKWLLTVSGSAPLKVLSLLRDPKGYLTNLSTATHGTADRLDP